jgi:hypothetical protein
LCHSLDRPLLLYAVLMSQWRYSLATDKMTVAMEIAKRVYSLADGLHDSALMVGAHRTLATTLFYTGDFQLGLQHARHGVQIWRAGGTPSLVEEVHAPAILCLSFGAMCEWMLGEVASCQAMMTEALSLGKRLNDTHALAMTLILAGALRHFENNPARVERCASDLIELSTRHHFESWLAAGEILHGWVRSVSGHAAAGVLRIEEGINAWQATGSTFGVPFWLALKAEALYLAHRTPEALAAIKEVEELVEKLRPHELRPETMTSGRTVQHFRETVELGAFDPCVPIRRPAILAARLKKRKYKRSFHYGHTSKKEHAVQYRRTY